MLDQIRKLFNSNVSTYQIAKESGVPENTVRRLRKGEAKLENATYINVEKLYSYKGEIKMIKGEVNKTGDLSEYEVVRTIQSDEYDILIELNTFEDGTKLYSVTTEMDGVSEENSIYFIGLSEAEQYAEKLAI